MLGLSLPRMVRAMGGAPRYQQMRSVAGSVVVSDWTSCLHRAITSGVIGLAPRLVLQMRWAWRRLAWSVVLPPYLTGTSSSTVLPSGCLYLSRVRSIG